MDSYIRNAVDARLRLRTQATAEPEYPIIIRPVDFEKGRIFQTAISGLPGITSCTIKYNQPE